MQENHIYDIDREAEAHGYENAQPNANFDLQIAKESIVPTFESNINTIIQGVESGEINALDAFASFKRLEAIFKDARERVDRLAFDEAEKYNEKTFSYSGVKFTVKQGSERLNYNEDHVCSDLAEKLKQRQELVKLATKSKDLIYDSEGIEVTKVSSKFDKSSLTVKF